MELVVRSVDKRFPGGVQALRDVSLRVAPGVFGLLGPNGAGKTTLMRIVATLLEPDAGTVTLDDVDVVRQKTELRRRLGYLPQEFGLDPQLRCEDLLDHLAVLKGIRGSRERRAEVGLALERTHLEEARRRRLGSFSGGMKRRFGIAQALLGRPRLLVVDEPTSGLDPEERTHLLDVLGSLGSDTVVVLSTHIVADVAETCHSLAVLGGGRVLAVGTPGGLSGALAGRVWEADAGNAATPLGAVLLRVRRVAGRRHPRVLGDGVPGDGFRPVAPDLEDAYFAALRTAAS